MAKYQYVGPEETRGHIPSWGFDDGILDPTHLASLLDRGQVVLVGATRAAGISSDPEPEPAPAPKRPARRKSRA